ncbi:probable ascorbate-specific transmembrane electron transporter 1 [Arachis hypogaea]|uniref:probable ascorbate-specific transmembrane electron transporter 1 n=1 Tax=Arachis hypogaea TaxID=3818 RepID=UPI000DED24BB
MEGSGKKVVAMKGRDWETKGEKLKKMGLGVPALPFTFVAHLLAVAAIVMVLLWNIHFRGGLAWEATNKNLILNAERKHKC